MIAIAAMSKNRVIGKGGSIPWRIPDEFKWFRRMTFNGVVIMGRKTFESLPAPLVGRVNIVLSRHPAKLLGNENRRECYRKACVGTAAHDLQGVVQLSFPQTPRTEVRLVRGIDSLKRAGVARNAWLCGGVQVYEQYLAECSELLLSVINREVEGDAVFPAFEHLFDYAGVVAEFTEFRVLRYTRKVDSVRCGAKMAAIPHDDIHASLPLACIVRGADGL
ncbi:MAG: dihydrofolate reductase [Pseudomonadota bacterium]